MQHTKTFYKIGRNKNISIIITNEEQLSVINELNRDFERTEKSNKKYVARCSSVEAMQEKDGFEIRSPSLSPEEELIRKENRAFAVRQINKAFNILTLRQKQVEQFV